MVISSPLKLDKRSLVVLTLTLLTILLFSLGCFVSYQKLRGDHQAAAREEAQRMLLAFEAHSTRLFDYADSYLRATRAYLADRGNGERWERFVHEIKAPHAELFSGIVTVIDRDGWVVYQSEMPRHKLKDFGKMSGLDHYQYFINHPGDSLFVGATRLGKLTGKQQFRMARPLFRDGAFDGLVVITLLPEHITDFYRSVSLGQHSTVTMLTRDAKLIARYPPASPEMYGSMGSDQKMASGIDVKKATGGSVFDVIDPGDNSRHDVFYKQLADYPVLLVIDNAELDIDDAIIGARRNLTLLAFAFTVIALVVCSMVLRMIGQNRRLASTEAASRESALCLQASEARLHSIFDASPDALLICDAQGMISMANRRVEHMLGYSVDELLGKSVDMLVPQGSRADHPLRRAQLASTPLAERMGHGIGVIARRKDGSECDVEISLSQIQTEQGLFIASALRDITERKQTDEQLRIAATAFESQEGMVVTDANAVILRVNRAFTEVTGYTAEEVVGQTPRLLKSDRHSADFYRAMWENINRTGGWRGEIWDRRKNGEVYPKSLTISAVKDQNGAVTHYIGTQHDITDRKRAEEKINELAFFDQLTSLPNRTLLLDRLKQTMVANSRNGSHGALLFIDLDNFKTLNDTLGHDMGDLLLKQVAQRLTFCMREGDTVARLGGDEFVVVLAGLSRDEGDAANAIETVAEKVLSTLSQPYRLGHLPHHSTASIGVTLFKGDLVPIDDLMKQADLAMYKSKSGGRNLVRFFDPTLESAVKEHAALEEDLRLAINESQFLLHYQVQVSAGRLTGVEALLRWQHPRRGMVSPAEFIPIAEETGLILPLGYWVLKTACAQLVEWSVRPEFAHLTVAVNVSAHQFHQADFVDQILAILTITGADPQRLKLELTESLLVKNVQDIIEKMNALKAKGVGFSLDDFGTGFSSLSYLKRLPLDQLKIDQSFVRDVLSDPNDAAIAKTVVALAQSLGLDVIAEGVETAAQREFLASSGCHAYQGYFFSRPLPIEGFERFVLLG